VREEEVWGIVALVFGAGGVVLGVLVRVGVVRAWRRHYYDGRRRRIQRNGVFGLIPAGLAFMVAGAMILLVPDDLEDPTPRLATALLVLGLGIVTMVLFIVSFWFWLSPPEWIKPLWLRQEQSRDAGPNA
jgi:drug/metabolite transporter (DMT)-like permease